MTLSSFLLTILWLIIIPVVAGGIFSFRSKGFVAEDAVSWEKKSAVGIFLWSWLLGQLLLWCVFQVIAVWMILHEYLFTVVVKYYLISVVALCLVSVVLNIVRVIRGRFIFIAGKAKEAETSIQAEDTKQVEALSQNTDSDKVFSETDQDSKEIKQERNIITVAWIVFFVVLAAQVVLQVVLAYMDADDAYYISEAVAIESSDYMYRLVPYTGLFTAMDYRHSLEPFPVWLAFVSRITGTQVVSMAHVFLPAVMLPLTYGAYSLMGHRVLGKKKKWLPIYMVIMEILVMFSLYSTKVPEKFFITRIRQGKSTISSLVPLTDENGYLIRQDVKKIVVFGNYPFAADADSENGMAALLAQATGAEVINCAIEGTKLGCTSSEMPSVGVPMDIYTPYYLTALMSFKNEIYDEFIKCGELLGEDKPANADEVVKTLYELDPSEIDVFVYMYDSEDYWSTQRCVDSYNEYSIDTVCGNVISSFKMIKMKAPENRIIFMSPYFNLYENEDGTTETCEFHVGLHGAPSTYFFQVGDAVNKTTSASFIDNLYGTITEANYEPYLSDNRHLTQAGRQKLVDRLVYAITYYSVK